MGHFRLSACFSRNSLPSQLIPKSASSAGASSYVRLLSECRKDTMILIPSSVISYHVSTGRLTLEHNDPRRKGRPATVDVDISAVLETVTATDLSVGTWLNVLGYVRDEIRPLGYGQRQAQSRSKEDSRAVYIDAILLFPAGAFEIGHYERVLRDYQEVDRRFRGLSTD